MERLLLVSIFALVVAVPTISAEAADRAERAAAAEAGKEVGPLTPRAANNQTAVACNLCVTCGGDWTVFVGSFNSPGSNNVTERGNSCSGALTTRTDSRPFLCCR